MGGIISENDSLSKLTSKIDVDAVTVIKKSQNNAFYEPNLKSKY